MEKRYTAKGGVNVYAYQNPALHGFYISLFVRAGSMYEGEGERGITHFLEHILVRNVNAIRGGGLYPALDKHALEFNASSYSEMVQFYVSGARENFVYGADIISDVLSPIVLSKDDIDTERRRIKAEIRESDDKNSIANLAAESVFCGTALSGSILGTNGSVDRISGKRLEEYRKRVFNSDNVFFYVTGGFSEEDIKALVDMISKKDILPAANTDTPHTNIAPVPTLFGKRAGQITLKNAEYTMIRFTFDVDMQRVSSPALDLIYDMLLSGYDSPFFIEMSEKRGLFYDISGSTERYRNIGTLQFTYEVKEKSIYDAAEITVQILNKFKSTTYPECECMKGGYVDNAYMLLDDGRELGFTLAYDNHIMSLGYPTLDDRINAYRSVTPEDIRRAACEIFKPENLTLTLKGKKNKIDTERLLQITSGLG